MGEDSVKFLAGELSQISVSGDAALESAAGSDQVATNAATISSHELHLISKS
jgi:hypothetical protein